LVGLTAAAAATTRLKVGTGVCFVAERDPIILAKQAASLDFLSGGRFLFGIGGGWNAEQMANHGTEYDQRWEILRERVLAMKEIWTKDEPEFHGEFVNFGPIWSWPKPVQKPHPPILLGANKPIARQRAVEYADGWFPLAERAGDIPAGIADLRRRAAAAGRDPDSLTVSVFGAKPDMEVLRSYEKAGVTRAIFGLPVADRDIVLMVLDDLAKFVEMFRSR
jgi:probable F420-dependent oxidoreductase